MGGWNVHYAKLFDRKRRKKKRRASYVTKWAGSKPRNLLKPEQSEIREPIKGKWVRRFADDLHRKMTPGELAFWRLVSRRKKYQCYYYPQFPLYGYIADFYCPRHRVAIELDGGYHTKQKEYDLNRDNFLRDNGICVVRFTDTIDENILLGYLHRVREICRMRHIAEIKPVGEQTQKRYIQEIKVAYPA